MKISNEKILNDASTLSNINKKQLPIKVSYAISKNINKLESELKVFNSEKNKLIEKYSEKDEKGQPKIEGGSIILQQDHIEDWNKEYKELLAIENEIEIHKFNMAEFECKSCDNFSPSEFTAIEYMIEE